ncbi:LPXTG cell wall anchor domain-containing protein, partial [Rothia sp. (in: high G+C Gram-positive bacteria)]|uniref:LPXTG cell wall anchor domain-containing protein n=1 Tax=Rothia sp. (in: high G+C Gram-positive bacteria) TaxID=1885016 RepID=UPI001CB03FEF
APVADKTPNADKLEDATVAHPKSKPAQSKPAQSKPSQEAPVTAARSAKDTLAKNTPAKDSLAKESSPKKATLANTGASSVGVIVGIGVVAICAGLGLSVLRSRRHS